MAGVKFDVYYAPSTREHIKVLSARDRTAVFDAVEKSLLREPGRETRNRKPLRNNPFASHERRVGHLRIFYRIGETARSVQIEAIGRKIRTKLLIGDEEVSL